MAERYVKLCIRIDNAVVPRAGMAGMVEHTEVAFEGIVREESIVRIPIGMGWGLEMNFCDDNPIVTLVADAEELHEAAGNHAEDPASQVLEMFHSQEQFQENPQDDADTLAGHAGDDVGEEETIIIPAVDDNLVTFLRDNTEDAWMGVAGPTGVHMQGAGVLGQARWNTTSLEISGAGAWGGEILPIPVEIDVGDTT